MKQSKYETERKAKELLKAAFLRLCSHHSHSPGKGEGKLTSSGIDVSRHYGKTQREIKFLLSYIDTEERECDKYLHKYCPAFLAVLENSPTRQWSDKEKSEQVRTALQRIKKAVDNIDSYAMRRGKELGKSLLSGIKNDVESAYNFSKRFVAEPWKMPDFLSGRVAEHFSSCGIGRPWGTEIRRRIAVALDIQRDVDNLWTLGLNSITNARTVYLGSKFIDKIREDSGMGKVIAKLESDIANDIYKKCSRIPYLEPQKIENRLKSAKITGLGGEKHGDDMLEQLGFTLTHPVGSLTKYSKTWNVALNELTWSLRNCTIRSNCHYHAVYNVAGFGFIWETEFYLEDTLDLRPRSGRKIDFFYEKKLNAYNIVTSLMGSVYHDLLGNTDKLKVRAKWTDCKVDRGEIHYW